MPRFPLHVPKEGQPPSLSAFIAFFGVNNRSQGTLSLYLDTGSSEVIIGERDKGIVEGFRDELKRSPRPLRGWGGAAEAYIIPEPNILILKDEQGKGHEFQAGELIYGVQQFKKKKGKYYPIPSVIGTRFLRKFNARVHLDYGTLKGFIEAP